jgi:hypothetical protein
MDSFAHELALPFPVRLENPHVVAKEQVGEGSVRCVGSRGWVAGRAGSQVGSKEGGRELRRQEGTH